MSHEIYFMGISGIKKKKKRSRNVGLQVISTKMLSKGYDRCGQQQKINKFTNVITQLFKTFALLQCYTYS